MANKKLTGEERLNSISDMQIQFDKLKKETGVLSGALQARPALEPPPAAPQMQLKVLAEKGIQPEMEPEEENEKQYEDILDEKRQVSSGKRVVTSDAKGNSLEYTRCIPTISS